MSRGCRGTKRNGESCTLPAATSSAYCWAHDPTNARERKENATKGGKSRSGGKLKELEDKLEALYDAIETGAMDRGTGAVLNQVLNTHVRLIEARHKLSELEELERQVAAIVEADRQEKATYGSSYGRH